MEKLIVIQKNKGGDKVFRWRGGKVFRNCVIFCTSSLSSNSEYFA